MRGLFFPVLIVVVLLSLGITWLYLRPSSMWPGGPRSLSDLSQAAKESKPSPTKAVKADTEVTGHLAKPRQVQAMGVPEAPTPPVESATPVPERRYDFPTAEQVVKGTPQTAIVATFGRPEAKVTGADKGDLRERYLYVDRTTGRRTYIFMVNAVVTGAQTMAQ